MNKTLKIVQASLVIIFVLVNIYLMVFNWSIYSVALVVDYGFGTFKGPLVIIVTLIGLVTILLVWLVSYTKDLQDEVRLMKVKDELQGLKNNNVKSDQELNHHHLAEKIAHLQQQIEALEHKSVEDKSVEKLTP